MIGRQLSGFGMGNDRGVLADFQRRIQSDQGLKPGVVQVPSTKLGDPALGQNARTGGGQRRVRCFAGPEAVPQHGQVSLHVHARKTSTVVLKAQPQKNGLLIHADHMDTNTRKIVAANIARLRKDRGMNQTELGSRAGVGQTTISSIENPEGKSPTLETLSAIAKALQVPEWTLLVDGSALDSAQLKALDHLVHIYADLPAAGKNQVQRVAEAEERYAKAG